MAAITGRNILRSDLVGEPGNLDHIETNLWLGNFGAASDAYLLEEKNVKFILTINSFPLPKRILCLNYINTKHIKVLDTPKDDLLSHFDEAHEFIDCAVKTGAVLVHCFHGVSRSPTIVMAYLMKKKNLTMEAALAYVKSKRQCVGPNPGFLRQLKLYEIMNWSLNKSNVQYKMFRLHITASYFEKQSVIPDQCRDVIKADPLQPPPAKNCTVYKCKKCRRVVALDSNVIPHSPKEEYSWSDCLKGPEICQLIYFIEPLSWMANIVNSVEGKLHCPNMKCNNKLGSFNWIAGCHCSCGTQLCPGFYLTPSKVDKQTIVTISKTKS